MEADSRPPIRDHSPLWLVPLIFLIVAGAAGAWWWYARSTAPVPAPVAMGPAAGPPIPLETMPETPPAAPEPTPPLQPLDAAGLSTALETLLGREAVLRLIQTTNLPQRIVATVDNLARDSAPASIWPVIPAPGRFMVDEQADSTLHTNLDNGQRYVPLVLLAESVDVGKLADWYRHALPVLQASYEQIGYPGQRFHTRLLAVLDHLLATPPAPQPLVLQLTKVQGPVPSTRPWVRYEFVDPTMEQASAGRKILWRVGLLNQRRLMKVLGQFRESLVAALR